MFSSGDVKRLNQLSDEIESLYKPIRVSEYNAPLNRDAEKARLFAAYDAGEVYNPQFEYKPLPLGLGTPLVKLLKKLRPADNLFEALLFDDVADSLKVIRTLHTHDPALITAQSIEADGLPTAELVAAAKAALAEPPPPTAEENQLDAQAAARAIRAALDSAQLTHWRVVITSAMNARMMVRGIEQQVQIRANSTFGAEAVKRLIYHEVGTHVFRYVNGAAQPMRLLRLGLTGYMMTEEGLATFNEHKFGVQDSGAQRRYALRVVAAHLALTQSFFDVFCYLMKHTNREDAFAVVLRAKRGFIDTAEHGAHVKDKVYFEGFRVISAHLAKNPEDYALLMSGKVALKMLPILRTLQNANLVKPPAYLPAMLVNPQTSF